MISLMTHPTSAIGATPEQVQQFEKDGFFLLKGLVPQNEIDAILERVRQYATQERPRPQGFEMQIEPRGERGELPMPADVMQAVRKMQGPVPGDDLITELVFKPRLVSAMQTVMGADLKLLRADFLMKPPSVGSAKGVHQDAPYWPFEPMHSASCWIALDAATLENGCMTIIPGSHK